LFGITESNATGFAFGMESKYFRSEGQIVDEGDLAMRHKLDIKASISVAGESIVIRSGNGLRLSTPTVVAGNATAFNISFKSGEPVWPELNPGYGELRLTLNPGQPTQNLELNMMVEVIHPSLDIGISFVRHKGVGEMTIIVDNDPVNTYTLEVEQNGKNVDTKSFTL
jgi:hypothetical protein